jgi:hypothetical protein
MEHRYKGGDYEYDAKREVLAAVVTELQRRYTGWIIQATYAGYRLYFTPIPATVKTPPLTFRRPNLGAQTFRQEGHPQDDVA